MDKDEGYRNLASSDAQEMPERSKNVEKGGKKPKKGRRVVLLCTAAVLLIAAAELAVLFAYFLPSPFPCRALRFDADEVTEILLVRERREQAQGIFQTVYDYARVTDPDAIAALVGSLGAISLREESGRRWTDVETDDRMGGPYYVRVTTADGTAQRFAFGAPGLLLLESGSPFSTEERESIFYRCEFAALFALVDPYFEEYPAQLSQEEREDCRPSQYLMKEKEYVYGG